MLRELKTVTQIITISGMVIRLYQLSIRHLIHFDFAESNTKMAN